MAPVTLRHQSIWVLLWHQLDRRSMAILTGLYVICVLVFIAAIPLPRVDGQLVGSDGAFYYAYLPALIIDGSLDFGNSYAKLLPPEALAHPTLTATGLLPNQFAIGPALLWSPFFLIGHALAAVFRAMGRPVALDGTGYIYQACTLIGSLTYGFLGILIIYRSCRRFFTRAASTMTAILIWLATNVIYYMLAEPSMSHASSLFAVALFIELWLASRPLPALRQWVLIGLAGGLVALVRLPDATYLALPVLDALAATKPNIRTHLRHVLPGIIAFGVAAWIIFIPQMATWQVLYGSPFKSGYLYSDQAFYWLKPHILEVLVSPLHGLFLWHPVLLFATGGLILFYRQDRRLAALIAAGFVVQIYVVSAWWAWSQGDSFGGRMFIGSLPVLALGLGALIEWAIARGTLPALELIGGGLIVWNALFFAQYRLGYISMSAPITLEQFTLGKLTMLADLWQRIVKAIR
jgi:hypothetical protein